MTRGTFGVALGLLLLGAAALRTVHPRADPPPGFVRGSLAEYTDEGFKTYHARNRVLFGAWLAHPEDRYTIWLVWSPVGVRLQALSFLVRGRVDVGAARELHVAASLAALGLWSLAVARERGPRVALLTAAFLATGAVSTVYGRMVFLENLILLFSASAAWILCRARVGPWHALAALLAALGGVLVKPTALLPVAGATAGVAAIALTRALQAPGPARAGRWRLARRAGVGTAALGAVLYVVLWLSPSLAASVLPLVRGEGLASPWEVARNLFLLQFAAKEPFLFALGVWGAGRALGSLLEGQASPPRLPVVAAGWLVAGLLGLALVEGSADRVRYAVILLPPLALLAAETVVAGVPPIGSPPAEGAVSWALRLVAWGLAVSSLAYAIVLPSLDSGDAARWPLLAGLLALSLLVAALLRLPPGPAPRLAASSLAAAAVLGGLLPIAAWLLAPCFETEAARADLRRRLPADAFVAGSWAPALALGTPLRCVRVGPDLNLRDGRLRRMAPTHLLLSDDRPEERAAVERRYPGLVRADGEVTAYRIERFTVRLYALRWTDAATAAW